MTEVRKKRIISFADIEARRAAAPAVPAVRPPVVALVQPRPAVGHERVTYAELAALAKKPADFKPEEIASGDTVPPDDTPATEIEGTVPPVLGASTPTRDTVSSEGTVPFVSAYKPARCISVQDGHSAGEDRLYNTLWNSRDARHESADTRLITMGWDMMSKASGMTRRNVKEICLRLIEKRAVEKVGVHHSETRTGATYRIYSFRLILDRRRAAGMEWVIRNRGGVKFVPPPTGGTVPLERETRGTVVTVRTDTVCTEGTDTVPLEPPASKLGFISHRSSQSSSSAIPTLSALLAERGIDADDAGLTALVSACQARAPDATPDEMAHFTRLKLDQAIRGRRVRNFVGFLQTAVPPCFEGELLRRHRAERAAAQRESREAHEEMRRCAEKTLEDPEASEAERAAARAVLGEEYGES